MLLHLNILEKRMSNMTHLSDIPVTPPVALPVLVFLPATGKASIFSTPISRYRLGIRDSIGRERMASSFWRFWAIALAIVGLLLGSVWMKLLSDCKNVIQAKVGELVAKSGRRIRE
jgi:hypothetical protein